MTAPDAATYAGAAAAYGETLEAVPDAVVVVNANGCMLFVNQQTELLFGYSRQELVGKPVEFLIPERFHARHIAHRASYVESPRVRPMGAGLELLGLRKDGREVSVEISLSPSKLNGEMVVISTLRDVTERKTVEARLLLQAGLIELARDAILVRDLDSRILEWNDGAATLYGWSATEARGQVMHTLLQTHFPASLEDLNASLERDGTWEGELHHVARDGRALVVESRQALVRNAAQKPFAILEVNRDVSVRRRAEVERDALLGRLQAMQLVTDAALAHLSVDALLPELLRRVRDALFADTAAILLLDDTRQFLIARAAIGVEEEVEQGVRIPVGKGFAGRVAAEGRPVIIVDLDQVEVVNPILDAKGIHSLLGVPLVVEGKILGVLHIGSLSRREFTAEEAGVLQRAADRAALALDHARLYGEAQEAVRIRNEFLSTISHDLANPVAAIRMASKLLQRAEAERTPDRSVFDGLVQIEATASRMWKQLEELLDLARLQMGRALELNWQPMDLAGTVRATVAAQEATAGGHTFRLELVDGELRGEWDQTRLERVLTNVLDNAVKYSPRGGEIVVRLRREEDSNRPSGWAVLEVQDPGIGIPTADLPHIFERFHRAGNVRGQFAGTGIGLAGAQQIVTLHGGELQIASQEGVGTRVTIRLPVGEDLS